MSAPDPLAGLREQIRTVTDAAERLVGDLAATQTPPAGWHQDEDAGAPGELAALARMLVSLREILPPELQQQVTDLVRQLLMVVRALIDWAVARLEQASDGRTVAVEDIPIG